MIDQHLLSILVCPTEHTALSLADEALISAVNRAIAAGRVRNQAGQPVERPLGGGLVRADGAILYPIVEGIPVLLSNEAISLDQVR